MFKTILVPIDLEHPDSWDDTLAMGVDMAKRSGARLHLLTVINATPAIVSNYLPSGYEAETSKHAREALEAAAGKLDVEGTVACHVKHGAPYVEILETADEVGADLILVESHRPGIRDYLLGTNAAKVVRHAKCSVFVLRVDGR
jgi:nucleotide-binding universal stress UspA family protein